MSAGWADAVASAPNVVSARIATKATVLLRRPAIMTIPMTLPPAEGAGGDAGYLFGDVLMDDPV